MDNSVQRKARMILAGLVALPALATAQQPVQTSGYCRPSPYSECDPTVDPSPYSLTETTGLTLQELNERTALVMQLNQMDIVSVLAMNLTQAPRLASRYNLPDPADVEVAKNKNLDRLAKIRKMIEAAK